MSRELEKVRRSLATRNQYDDFAVDFSPTIDTSGMSTFRYSYTEISSRGGDIHVKKKETRYANGKLTSEECEGTLDRNAYNDVVRDTQTQFLNQVMNFVKLFYR